VAELGAEPGRAAEDPAVDHDPAAHAGAERVHDEIARGAALDELGLGERRAVGVVLHVDRKAEAVLEVAAQLDARERDVHAGEDGARGEVDLRRHADPDRQRRRLRALDHLARGGLDPGEDRLARVERGRVLHLVARPRAGDERSGDLGPADVDADRGGLCCGGGHERHSFVDSALVDRRLAQKNIRTALIAGLVGLFVFAAAWVAAAVY
jgi:hypothetical protein